MALLQKRINELGGIETARTLILSHKIPDGYVALWEKRCLDLTFEALIYEDAKWHALFSEEELAICTYRLKKFGAERIYAYQ